jgi:hypothetical protein
MTCRKTLEQWATKAGNCEVMSQALWPIAKSLMKRGEPKAPTAIHGPSGITYQPNKKKQCDCGLFGKPLTSHDL